MSRWPVRHRGGRRHGAFALTMALIGVLMAPGLPAAAATLPAGFQDTAVMNGLVNPTRIAFSADGRVFVAEKSGIIKVFDGLGDTTPTIFADLRTSVHNFWDRGLLGMALAPGFPADPHVYVLYTYDAAMGGVAPRWGVVDQTGDGCANPPGATIDGCVVSARLSRLTAGGDVAIGEQVLINDWCQQYPSHSIGDLVFGPDGALYASAGDGASFTFADYGQAGFPADNPCGDPPTGVGGAQTPPTAEGGALRSQDVRTIPPGSSPGYPTAVTSLGPRAYWRLGETSGTIAADQTGAHAGSYVGGPTLGRPGALAGDPDTAVAFDNVDDRVEIPNNAGLNVGQSDFTMAAWFRTTDTGWGVVASKRNSTCTCSIGWTLGLDANGTFHFGLSNGSSGPVLGPSSGGYRNGAWHFLTGVRSGATATLYVDGVAIGSGSGFGVNVDTQDPVRIGRTGEASTVFNGDIDEVALFPSALSAGQIGTLYQAGITPPSGGGGGGTTDPTGLNGTVIRIDPATGEAAIGNPLNSSPDPGARRIIAYGMRNPFRLTFRPGTSELWVGDVGNANWEEIDLIASSTDGQVENFGWPCYEGVGRLASFDALNLDLCESLYGSAGAVTSPYFTYNHNAKVVTGESCPTGSSSISGLAFYPGGSYPAAYNGALFFTDYSRNCIWVMYAGANGRPDPATVQTFVAGAAGPVSLTIGPSGDLFYPDFTGGTIHRVQFLAAGNLPPTAVITSDVSSGPAPLAVQFSGAGSSDPDPGDTITYAWDLDADGQYDDSTIVNPTHTYATGSYLVGLLVTDPDGATDTATRLIQSSNDPPVPTMQTPLAGATWRVGDTVGFTGSATDAQDGSVPASRLDWTLAVQHCPSNCHEHIIQTWSGVASGSFSAPDHDYPSYLELRLKATDANGSTTTVVRRLDPQTVVLGFATSPSGLQLTVGATTSTAPFSRTVIVGSQNSVSALTPQALNGTNYAFSGWSDAGAQSHVIVAPAGATTYTATYAAGSTDVAITQTGSVSGRTLTMNLRVENLGPLAASNVTVTDVLPNTLIFNTATPGQGSCSYQSTNRTVSCALGTLANGQVVTVQLVATSAKSKVNLDNTATVTTSTPEVNTANNSATLRYRN